MRSIRHRRIQLFFLITDMAILETAIESPLIAPVNFTV
jgi:hypothetical protein